MIESHKGYVKEADLREYPEDYFDFCFNAPSKIVRVVTKGD